MDVATKIAEKFCQSVEKKVRASFHYTVDYV